MQKVRKELDSLRSKMAQGASLRGPGPQGASLRGNKKPQGPPSAEMQALKKLQAELAKLKSTQPADEVIVDDDDMGSKARIQEIA